MKIYTKEEAIQRIDRLANAKKTFVFAISYDRRQAYVEEVGNIHPDECLFYFPGLTNAPKCAGEGHDTVEWSFVPPSQDAYRRQLKIVQDNILAGNSYLVNLTCRVPIETNLSFKDIFFCSKAKYKMWIKDRFVCFSPETFVTVSHGVVRSYPMKGTIDATVPDAEKRLMENEKEAAEHATIVDLIRNDLSMVADRVRVNQYRYVERLNTNKGSILQTSSEICGEVTPYYLQHIGELLFSQLPAGSITGAPKKKTVEIIAEAEDYERGFYTGVMGCCHDGEMDSAVMIRFVDTENGQFYYKAGGGITAKSICKDEYQEVLEKIYVPIY
ncbi:MAG: aminodeoxychorismate synthase component I [Prevotellaceae bacterium]|nr:aminodeoxychorismate synthase component I [Prevotella sp.]MDD7257028.1 aminodeoxychorismate synthase component I [Prevotellaceae bacterium]